ANDAFVTFMDAVREPEAPDLTIEKLVGVYRVLIPRFIAAYTYHLNGTSRITDAPTIRSLKFALQDEFEDWRDGEMLIQSLLDTPEKVGRATRRQEELEQLVLASGGIAGPGSLGEPAQEESVEERRCCPTPSWPETTAPSAPRSRTGSSTRAAPGSQRATPVPPRWRPTDRPPPNARVRSCTESSWARCRRSRARAAR